MDITAVSAQCSEFLNVTCKRMNEWLTENLPKLDPDWWHSLVLPKLSYQQRERVDRMGVNSLDRLDLAALLRIVDQNWYLFSEQFRLSQQDRNYVKEMQSIRNQIAHMDAGGMDGEEIYRIFDTLQRFHKIIGSPVCIIERIAEAKRAALGLNLLPAGTDNPIAGIVAFDAKSASGNSAKDGAAGGWAPPMMVSLKSDATQFGPLLSIEGDDDAARCTVFLNGQVKPFYRSQLQPYQVEAKQDVVRLRELHGLLTALQLKHPSLNTLYSLNAARIDFVPYQFRPALKIIRSDQPRLLIADSVGVGKTIEAGLIMRELQARNNIESVLVICPKPLVAEKKWEQELKRFDEQFFALDGNGLRYCIREMDMEGEWPEKYEKCILPYSLLQDEGLIHGNRGTKKSRGLIDLDPPPKFDLVIVDEAHHVRNANTYAHQAVRFFCEHAEAVVFLTATPIQLGNQDLFTLLNLLRPDLVIDQATFNEMAAPNPFINQAINQARSWTDNWQQDAANALNEAAATPWGHSLLRENPRFKEVLRRLLETTLDRNERVGIIRVLEEFHSFSRLINRTRRRDIGTFCIRKPETVEVPFTSAQQELHDALLAFQAKALESLHGTSNVKFMMSTLRRRAASCIFGLAPFIHGMLANKLSELEWLECSEEDTTPSDLFAELENEVLAISAMVEALPPDDPKCEALLGIIGEKIKMPNNKLMVFSSFRHTLTYLHEKLMRLGIRVGLVHGDIKDEDRMELRHRFERPKEDSLAIDVMLFSEVGCEGLDYQFCDMMVNYDLPWNPMKIEQRIGRIDRRGQKSEAVAIYNIITPGTVDADIYQRCLLRIGVFESSIGECEQILGDISREIRDIAENIRLTAAERQHKLEQLADNEISALQEQAALEEKEHELFGLRIPKSNADGEVQAAESYWLSAGSIQNFVVQYLSHRLGDGEYVLGSSELKSLRLSENARGTLLKDFQALQKNRTPIFRSWNSYLKGAESHCSITFDSATAADHREAQFIMPLHPLVLQAAACLDAAEPVYTAFSIQTGDLMAGKYPFAIYAWDLKGLRSELMLYPVCAESAIQERFFEFLEMGASINPEGFLLNITEKEKLDRVHHSLWEAAKVTHQDKTAEMVNFRRESLTTSHTGRVNVLRGQIAAAMNDKIHKMKQAQMNNIESEYLHKLAELNTAHEVADIHARPVVFGMLVVVEE
jgi:ATP-dependent helicase HepA